MNGADGNLVGQYFLTFDDEGHLGFHGEILDCLEPGYFLCQLFSAFTDEPTNSIIQPARHMTGWKFFDDVEQWNRAYRDASSKGRQ